jgi:thymidylate kinase
VARIGQLVEAVLPSLRERAWREGHQDRPDYPLLFRQPGVQYARARIARRRHLSQDSLMVDDPGQAAKPADATNDPVTPLTEIALTALAQAGVTYRLRKPFEAGVAREVDIWLAPSSQDAAAAALAAVGFHVYRAPVHRSHRFFLGLRGGRWLKVDAKLEEGEPRSGRLASVVVRAVDRVRPASTRRLGPVVAVLGPDGAGKGTVLEALRREIPVGVSVIYHGRRRNKGRGPRRQAARARPAGELRESAFVLRNYLRSWRALSATYIAAWRGDLVLCDRHPIEGLAVRSPRPPIAGRLERLLARRLTPWPDAIVVLDAPAETLFERKAEHSLEVLERWRLGYRSAFDSRAIVVSSAGPLSETVAAVSAVVWQALCDRRWPSEARGS